jgi:hypothetical protein
MNERYHTDELDPVPPAPPGPSEGRPAAPLQRRDADRAAARRSLEAKRRFQGDLVTYVAVNAFLVVVWLLSDRGYFWPGWVMAGWGLLLALKGWAVYVRTPISEADIEAEMRRGRR